MNNFIRRATRAAVVVVAAVSLTATAGIPTASAADPGVSLEDTYCGDALLVDGILMRSCWFPAYDDMQPNAEVWAAGVIMRMPTAHVPSSWSKCTVRSAIYRNSRSAGYSRMRPAATTDNGALDSQCLPKFRQHSNTDTRFYFYDTNFVSFQPGSCYYTIGRWFGTYAGSNVGMNAYGPFPKSVTKCGRQTGIAPIDALDAPIVDIADPEVDVPTMVGA